MNETQKLPTGVPQSHISNGIKVGGKQLASHTDEIN